MKNLIRSARTAAGRVAALSLPLAALSSPVLAASPQIALWNTYLDQHPVLECYNSTSVSATSDVLVKDLEGNDIHSIALVLAPQQSIHVLLRQFVTPGNIGALHLSADSTISCHLAQYAFWPDGELKFAEISAFQKATNDTNFFVVNSHQPWNGGTAVQNWLSLHNCGNERTNVSFTTRASDGSVVKDAAIDIAAGGRRDFLVSSLESPSLESISVHAESDGCVFSQLRRLNSLISGAQSFVRSDGLVRTVKQTSLAVSLMHNMHAWLELANPNAEPIELTLRAYQSDGTLLEVMHIRLDEYGHHHLNLSLIFPPNSLGSVLVEAATEASYSAEVLHYGRGDRNIWSYASRASVRSQRAYLPANSYLRSYQWSVLLGGSAEAQDIKELLLAESGESLRTSDFQLMQDQRSDSLSLQEFERIGAAVFESSASAMQLAANRHYLDSRGRTLSISSLESQSLRPEEAALRLQLLTTSLTQPVHIEASNDGSNRLFILERTGRIRVFADGHLADTAFLDISAQVGLNGEQGLLGLAFAPDFESSRYFYVHYSNTAGDTVISRWRANSDRTLALSDSEEVILLVSQPNRFHNGGPISFGPDGMLYIALGDGGGAGDPYMNGQDKSTLLGAILRIAVGPSYSGYTIPSDNPFVGDSDAAAEIFAYGFRNPWRMSFDRSSGRLFVADVGQNTREEINIVVAGGNYGWNTMEGTLCYPSTSSCDQSGLLLPILEYGRELGAAVVGGFVYRGSEIPALQGNYVFTDFISGSIFIAREQDGRWDFSSAAQFPENTFPTSFGEDEAKELYAVGITGSLYKVVAE